MNKTFGLKSDFALVKEDASRVIIGYGMTPDADGIHATWKEIDFYKKQGKPGLGAIKEAVKADINAATDERIIKGFVWNGIPVWLSSVSSHSAVWMPRVRPRSTSSTWRPAGQSMRSAPSMTSRTSKVVTCTTYQPTWQSWAAISSAHPVPLHLLRHLPHLNPHSVRKELRNEMANT